MKLIGKKIYLRPIAIEDACEEYVSWLNDADVNQYLESRFVLATIENVKKFIESTLQSDCSYFFAIIDNATNKHIGNIKIGTISNIHKRGDIGILIGNKNFWGKGIASEAIELLTEFSFNVLNLNKVFAGCYANNIGSYKAFIKCGFQEEGLLKKHCLSSKGEVIDVYLLAKHKS